MAPKNIQPSFETVQNILLEYQDSAANAPNLLPLCATISGALLTPSAAYLKISNGSQSELSFLFESVAAAQTIGRHSFVGANPRKVLKTGPGHGPEADPLPFLQEELSKSREAIVPGLDLPPLTGGAIGYVGYDCVRYFEPRTARPMKDILQVPESLFMLFDTIVAFDHAFSTIKVITYIHLPTSFTDTPALQKAYNTARQILASTISTLQSPHTPLPPQQPIPPTTDQSTNISRPGFTSNIGSAGYKSHVRTLKHHIWKGDIFQAVPSHRLSRPTSLHPFNLYSHLRTLNPSPYLFYISCSTFHLVGASPELLVKSDENNRIITHPIAGTVPRGKSPQKDEELAQELRDSEKDRAEHVMLVDLARNDINRVCDPWSTRVDRLMVVEKFSHVQHLVSQVSGLLREGKTRFDALRSIFPAGTVSGAPKVRAMELIAELEKEKRGVYAGAVGYFGYGNVDVEGREGEGKMDTCIALRTMMVKGGVAYLQAGGGIVFDSQEEDEWVETMNKLGSNISCVESAEEMFREGVVEGIAEDESVVEGEGMGMGKVEIAG
ncbi:MAG: hypothetical protein Q9169_006240 [Polycauliona sp. 2 TL-2023]